MDEGVVGALPRAPSCKVTTSCKVTMDCRLGFRGARWHGRKVGFSVCLSKEGWPERNPEVIRCRGEVFPAAAWARGSSRKNHVCQRANGRGRFSACPQPLARPEGLAHQTFNEPNYILAFSSTAASVYPPARSRDLPVSREPGWLANLGPVPAPRSFGFRL